jgi:hypothetical protein
VGATLLAIGLALVGGCRAGGGAGAPVAMRQGGALPAADPSIGPSGLRTHAAVVYITPAKRVADERYGEAEAAAGAEYSGFTSTGRFRGESRARAAPGSAITRAAADAHNATFPVNTALAEAAFEDTFVVESPSFRGPARVVFTIEVSIDSSGRSPLRRGAGHGHGAPEASSHLFIRRQGIADAEVGGDPLAAGTIVTDPLPITLGEPFSFGLLLSTAASIPLNYSATVSEEAAARLARVDVLDADGRPMPDAVVRSAGGAAEATARPR